MPRAAFCTRPLRAKTSMDGMDFVAVALALLAFIALYGLIALVDRI
ncbi:hypothetical protein [Solirubrobacter deserti]|nr:hypothetical protein [Solirubrobacter deserti]